MLESQVPFIFTIRNILCSIVSTIRIVLLVIWGLIVILVKHGNHASIDRSRAHSLTTNKSYAVSQGVGQGRTLSAWIFLVMIKDTILLLESIKSRIQVCTLCIPRVLLADDTSLISSSFSGMSVLLRILNDYEVQCW